MATFRNRHGKWQARVQRKGQQPVSKSFQNKEDAQRWARQVEAEIDKGSYTNIALAERTLFKDVIERYVQEVTPKTRSMKEDTYRLRALARHPIANLCMTALTPMRVAEYRDERLTVVSAGTVIRELSYFSSIFNLCKREWGLNVNNPIPLVKKPPSPQGRNRILTDDELGRLFDALKPKIKSSNHWVLPLTKFALESAMRRGEILGLRWEHVDLQKRIAFIPLTKNGRSRTAPLSSAAVEILRSLPRNLEGAAIINLCEVAEHFPNPKSSFDNIFSCNPKIVVVQTGIFNEPDVSWSYLAPEHGQHIFFYSEKTISYLAKAHCMAATFIQGYIIFIKIELLESLFIKNTNTLKVDFVSKLNQSIQNLFNKILTNGYKYAINDNLMLTKSLQIR